jgi:hypothetical protein
MPRVVIYVMPRVWAGKCIRAVTRLGTDIAENDPVEVRVDDKTPSWEEPSDLEARYANCFKVGYNAFELVIDFGQVSGAAERARLTSRIVTNPRSAKALHEILGQSLEEYERTFGVIQEKED